MFKKHIVCDVNTMCMEKRVKEGEIPKTLCFVSECVGRGRVSEKDRERVCERERERKTERKRKELRVRKREM